MSAAADLAALERTRAVRTVSFAVIALAAAFLLGRCYAGRGSTPLPPAFANDLEKYMIVAALDTAEAQVLRRQRDSATAAARDSAAAAARSLRAANIARARADSLERAAAASRTAADSATRYRIAYGAKSEEADSLRRALDAQTSSSAAASSATLFAGRADSVQTNRADAAQGTLDKAVTVIHQSDPQCRFAYVLGCPSRKAVFVGTAIGTAAAIKFGPQLVKAIRAGLTIKI